MERYTIVPFRFWFNEKTGTNIVVRSPFSRKWLFNITIAPKRESLEIKPTSTVAPKIGHVYALIAFALLFFGACSPVETEESGVAWYSDYTIEDTFESGKVFYAGADTLLHVNDPIITYYSDYQIKAAIVTVFHDGIGYPVACTIHAKQVRVFNDVIYGAGPDVVFLPTDKIRFGIEAY